MEPRTDEGGLGEARPPDSVTTLDNGLRVISVASKSSGFEAAILFSGGPLLDPVDRPGLTEWTVRSALLGTEGDPSERSGPHTRALALGVTLVPIAHGDVFGWGAYGPRGSYVQALAILRDIATRPAFPATALQLISARERHRVEARGEESLSALVAIAVGHALGLGRPLALEPTAELFDVLVREDVLRHWRRWFRPERATLVLSQALRDPALWGAWRSEYPEGEARTPCIPHGQSSHLVAQESADEDNALLLLAAAIPGSGSPGHMALSAWFGWLGERPEGPLARSLGAEQGRRATPSLVDLATGPASSISVALSGLRGTPTQVLEDLEGLTEALAISLPTDQREAFKGSQRALAAERIRRHEAPLARLIMYAKEVFYGHPTPSGLAQVLSLIETHLAPWRFTFAGLGHADFAHELEKIAPLQRWDSAGVRLGGAPSPRCEPKAD